MKSFVAKYPLSVVVVLAGLLLPGLRGADQDSSKLPIQLQGWWTTESGLPSNTIRALLQTRDGYLWIGTKFGVARFDGVRFKVYKDELRLGRDPDIACQDLEEDGQERVWIRLPGGLVCYERGTLRNWPRESIPIEGTIQMIRGADQGGLWIGTQNRGLYWFDGEHTVKHWGVSEGLASAEIQSLSCDGQGRVWVRSGGNSFPLRLDPRTGHFEKFEQVVGESIENAVDLCVASDESIWIATETKLLHWQNNRVARFDLPAGWSRRGRGFGGLAARGSQELWFAPEGLGLLVRFENGQFTSYGAQEELADADIRPHLVDREGNLWVGYGADGLQRFRPGVLRSHLALDESGGRQQLESVALAPDGAFWLGTWNGLLRWDGQEARRYPTGIAQPSAAGPVLVDKQGQVWFGIGKHGLYRWNSGVSRVDEADCGRAEWSVRALFEDSHGTLWIGSDSGLLRKDIQSDRFRRFTRGEGLAEDRIVHILEGRQGDLWIGTRSGITVLRDEKFQSFGVRDGLPESEAWPLHCEESGSLWMGTAAGLYRISRSGKIASVTESQGLYADEVFSLLDDGLGNYWGNSGRGVFRVRQENLNAVASGEESRLFCISYGRADGAITVEGTGEYQPNACRTADGRFWFCTTRGLTEVNPRQEVQLDASPLVAIEEVLADERVVYVDGRVLHPEARPGDLRIPPGQSHGLEIRYTSPTFAAPEKVRFRYQLAGAERDWHEATSRRAAFYTNLRPGTYRFLVEASNREGVWSRNPASLRFILEPTLTQRAWFAEFCAAALAAAVAAFVFWRFRWQKRVLLAEHAATLERERARIARDLHDDLGSALTGLALELEVIRKQIPQSAGTERLMNTAGRTRSLAERMREVVWAVNPRCDNLRSLAAFLEEQIAQFLSADGLRGRFEFPEDIPALPIGAETRHQLALATREALTNVVRHSGATEVTVSLAIREDRLIVSIADNGNGSPAAGREKREGSGLANMRERLLGIGGAFHFQGGPSGSTVEFQVPLRARNQEHTL